MWELSPGFFKVSAHQTILLDFSSHIEYPSSIVLALINTDPQPHVCEGIVSTVDYFDVGSK